MKICYSRSYKLKWVPSAAMHAYTGGGSHAPPTTLGTKTGVEPSEIITSRETYPGIDAVISITGGIGQLSKNSDVTWGAAVNMLPGDYYQARAQASAEFNTSVEVEVDVPDTFTITTRGPDRTPDVFVLIPVEDAEPNTLIESNPPTISGIDNDCPVSIVDGEYEINQSDVWSDQPGTIDNNNVVVVRRLSGGSEETVSCALTIGTSTRNFVIATRYVTPPDPGEAINPDDSTMLNPDGSNAENPPASGTEFTTAFNGGFK